MFTIFAKKHIFDCEYYIYSLAAFIRWEHAAHLTNESGATPTLLL